MNQLYKCAVMVMQYDILKNISWNKLIPILRFRKHVEEINIISNPSKSENGLMLGWLLFYCFSSPVNLILPFF